AKNLHLRVVQKGNLTECPIEQVIIKAMQYYPEHRFKDAEEMRRALQACLSSNNATTIQTSARSPNATIIVRPVEVICPQCGFVNRPEAKFCKHDGQPLLQGATAVPPQPRGQTTPRVSTQAKPVPRPALARSVPPPPPPPIRARPITPAPTGVDHTRLGREAMKN